MRPRLVAIAVLALLPAAAALDVAALRVAIIDGAPYDGELNGVTYSSAGVTGSGTATDPWVIEDRFLDLHAEVDGPQILILRSDNVRVERANIYAGEMPYQPWCTLTTAGTGTIALPEDFGAWGILVDGSRNVVVYDSILGHGRHGAMRINASDVRIEHTDFRENFGGGIYATNGSSVTSNLNRWHNNGYSQYLYRDGVSGLALGGANVLLQTGSQLTMWGDNHTRLTHNGIFVDKRADLSTAANISETAFHGTYAWTAASIVDTLGSGDCTGSRYDWNSANRYQPGPFDRNAILYPPTDPEDTSSWSSTESLSTGAGSDESPDCELDVRVICAELSFWSSALGPKGIPDVSSNGAVALNDLVDYYPWVPAPPAPAALAGPLRDSGVWPLVSYAVG